MKKIILLGLVAVLLHSCGSNTNNTPTSENNTATQSTENVAMSGTTPIAQGTYENDLKSVSSKIKDSNEFKGCMDMQVPMCIQSAGMQIAQNTKSTEFCNELARDSDKESCIFAVTLINAQEKQDTNLCKTLSGSYADQCMSIVIRTQASTQHNPKLCNTIPTASGNTTERDQCILSTIMSGTGGTVEDCGLIQEESSQTMCKDMLKNRP